MVTVSFSSTVPIAVLVHNEILCMLLLSVVNVTNEASLTSKGAYIHCQWTVYHSEIVGMDLFFERLHVTSFTFKALSSTTSG